MHNLTAETLKNDPRIAEAKRLILEAIADQKASITGVRQADPRRKEAYQHALDDFGELRGGPLFYPYLGAGIGNGALVELTDGSVKYDMISGIGVHFLGHSHPALVEAVFDAALQDTVMQGNLQQNQESLAFTRTLLRLANKKGAQLAHCNLTTSGAMANENSLKIIFQKHHPASRILAFEGCFAGRTLASAAITDNPAYRQGLPKTLSVDYVPFYNEDNPSESTKRSVEILQQHLAHHPGQYAGMCLELVQGEGGYYPGDRNFFTALIEVLKSHKVAVMIDEIQSFGRTSELFAFQHFGLDEHVDVVTVGKMTQTCATLYASHYQPKPGLISQTFTTATSALSAAMAILKALEEDNYFGQNGRIQKIHDHFVSRLQEISISHPDWVSGPFGIGAMVAFTPFDGKPQTVKTLLNTLFDDGVIAFFCGYSPQRVRFLVPVGGVTTDDISAVCDIVQASLSKVAETL